jgi:hypothetical protein
MPRASLAWVPIDIAAVVRFEIKHDKAFCRFGGSLLEKRVKQFLRASCKHARRSREYP